MVCNLYTKSDFILELLESNLDLLPDELYGRSLQILHLRQFHRFLSINKNSCIDSLGLSKEDYEDVLLNLPKLEILIISSLDNNIKLFGFYFETFLFNILFYIVTDRRIN